MDPYGVSLSRRHRMVKDWLSIPCGGLVSCTAATILDGRPTSSITSLPNLSQHPAPTCWSWLSFAAFVFGYHDLIKDHLGLDTWYPLDSWAVHCWAVLYRSHVWQPPCLIEHLLSWMSKEHCQGQNMSKRWKGAMIHVDSLLKKNMGCPEAFTNCIFRRTCVFSLRTNSENIHDLLTIKDFNYFQVSFPTERVQTIESTETSAAFAQNSLPGFSRWRSAASPPRSAAFPPQPLSLQSAPN